MTTAGTTRGPYRTGRATRKQIVDEAVKVFGSSGYNGGSLRSIAERVGVSPGTINRHFASKEDLLNAVLERWTEDIATAIDESSHEGLAVLRDLRTGMEYHEEHPHLLGLFLLTATEAGAEDHPGRPFMRTRYSNLIGRYEESLRRAVQHGEIQPLDDASISFEARAIVAFTDGIEIQYLLDPDFSLVEAFDEYWERCLRRWGARTAA